ncbi:hypothetical protein GTW25_08850 [Aliihoeflea aestuarii]|jgi:hypothetical protein|uniref:hypothetical protein n=1 Tax=Aliihoeflea aestuarii TaxID=453840 RepID=UPI0020927BDE|nr:hypothetical protein [Aliihoeflea aestuarii]MCO6391134.1 hypothetical protein [Aliihoeflea aestuarii]
MADFVAVLKKTIDGLKDNSPQMRERVYDKARATIDAKLAALNPPPPAAVADRQRQSLEAAIVQVRGEYDVPPPAADPDFEEDFSNFFGDEPEAQRAPAPSPADAYRDEPYDEGLAPADERVDDDYPAESDQPLADDYTEDFSERPYSDAYADDDRWPADDAHRQDNDFDSEETVTAAQPIYAPRVPPRRKRRPGAGTIASLLLLLLIAGAGYGVWLNRDDFASILGSAPTTEDSVPVAADDDAATPTDDQAAAPAETDEEKFTQRLLEDGSEVDDGAAADQRTLGEGTSIAAVTPPEDAQGATSGPAAGQTQDEDQPQLAVGQRAIFYEERTANAEGSAETGTILWSLVQESPGGDLPPEAAIRAEVTVPSRDLQLRMTIRRNGDQSLPASHIIEMIFLTPDNFEGGTIDNVLRVAMKDTEQAAGSPLIGIPAKIADGFFLVALSDSSAEQDANTNLMRRQNWIDVPIVYGSGRRALMTMEKGIPGDRVFQEALRAWSQQAPLVESDEGQ